MQQGMQQLEQLQHETTIDQVLTFLKDNRAKSFVLDIETDSTIMADEDGEKQRRTEFVGVLGQLLPQLSTMIQNDPGTAPFCGEVLKFATAPFRAGRALDGAIDELIEQVKAKGAQPQPMDPATQQAQIALQIENIKDQTNRAKLAADVANDKAKLDQADRHKQWELSNQREIAQMKASGDTQEAQVDMAVQGQKMQESREAHAMTLQKAQIDMQTAQQKAALTERQHAMRAQDQAARIAERQDAQRMRQMQQPGGGGGI
jgi:acetyl/propionyl-CoA carboxylase alpha subunit